MTVTHIVFTSPAEINPLVLQNKKLLYNIFFKASSKTLLEFARDDKFLGGKIGFIAVLHTWGQNLMDHPHIHCVVTGGGLSDDETRWCPAKHNFLFPVKALSKVFKNKFLYYLKREYHKGHLQFPDHLKNLIPKAQFLQFCQKLMNKDWVVHSKPPFNSAENVLKYLSRYTDRVAIANKRIIGFKNGKVSFHWKDYSNNGKMKVMTLDALEFMRRFLLHVLPTGFTKIRYYGILSNRQRKTKLKAEQKAKDKINSETWQESLLRLTGFDITLCPICGKGTMITLTEPTEEVALSVA